MQKCINTNLKPTGSNTLTESKEYASHSSSSDFPHQSRNLQNLSPTNFNIFTPNSSEHFTHNPISSFARPVGRAPQSVNRPQIPSSPFSQSRFCITRTPQTGSNFQGVLPTPTYTGRTPRTGGTARPHQENVTVALVNGRGIAKSEVGIASINLVSSELHLSQMSDSSGFFKTITKLNIFRPSEVIVPETLFGPGVVSPLIERILQLDPDITISPVQRSAFSDAAGIQYIKKLAVIDHQSVLHVVEQKYYALAAAGALIHHLEGQRNVTYAAKTLRVYYQGTESTALVDSETAQRLELVSSIHTPGGPSLMTSLNYCQTSAGSRLLRSNILEPLTDRNKINQRLDAIEEITSRPSDLLDPIKSILARFVDVDRSVNQCILIPNNPSMSVLESRINAIIALKHILALVTPLRAILSNANNPLMRGLYRAMDDPNFEILLNRIHHIIDDQVKPSKGRIGMLKERCRAVKPRINDILDLARQTYRDMILGMEDYAEELSGNYHMALTLANTSTRDFHLQMAYSGQKNRIPPIPREFICVKKLSNHIAFTTEQLLVKNERLKVIQNDIHKITDTVIEELLVSIREDIGSFYKLRDIVSQLDVVVSLSQVVAIGVGFCRPQFGHSIIIRHGRHPILNRFGEMTVIANDTDLTPESNVQVITGANLSGKSTYIRQVMLLQIMAQIGSYLPASSATVRIFDKMLSRLGCRDSLENNASSFSKEMLEMNYIVRNADKRSLVIIDELCKETSVDEGNAICWSFCESLIKAQAWFLIATHNTLISKLEQIYFNVTNYYVEVTEEQQEGSDRLVLNYTHHLKRGVSAVDNYGMKLAALAGLLPDVMDRAHEMVPVIRSMLKPSPKVPLQYQLNRLYYSCALRLRDLKSKIDSVTDDEFLEEMQQFRNLFAEKYGKLNINKLC